MMDVSRETKTGITLQKITAADRPVLQNLLEKYLYEFSAYDGRPVDAEGLYGYPYLDAYFEEEGRWPFFIRSAEALAGFVLVRRHDHLQQGGEGFTVAELCVLPPYRKGGTGRQVMAQLFLMFRGPWQVKWHPRNAAAAAFWQRVVEEKTGGRHTLHKAVPDMVYLDGTAADLLAFDTALPPAKRPSLGGEVDLRLETREDYAAAEALTRRAFWNIYAPGCSEHYLLHRMRKAPAYLPQLSRVAVLDGQVVGGIWYALGQVVANGQAEDIPLFGPLSVDPAYQHRGIGSRLITDSMEVARKAGYKAIILFGDPAFYAHFGYDDCRQYGITTATGDNFEAFMAAPLYEGALNDVHGAFHVPSFYADLPQEDIALFDAQYPYMEKLVLPGQLGQA